jgi:tRNA pseudouridine38-40 synthase
MTLPADSGEPTERWLRVTVEYDGTNFLGFQRQARGRTVQAVLETALGRYTPEPRLLAAGRTDAGVHACGQVIHFRYHGRVPITKLVAVVNGQLPADVAIRDLRETGPDFHARYSALSRIYRYHCICAPGRQPLRERYAWRISSALDLTAMAEAVASLPGTHSFRHFGTIPGSPEQRRLSQQHRGWRRTVLAAALRQEEDRLRFDIEADAFLTHMVRAIVGALIAIGRGQVTVAALQAALDDDTSAVPLASIAPPHGLCLFRVRYPGEE